MRAKPPDVSVIIPSFNRRRFTTEAIESALDQSDVLVEVIVVDDGSSDDTCEWIRNHYAQVRLFQDPHRGACAARNHGLLAARGRYLKFLDSDDLLLSGSLQSQVAFIDQTRVDICYGDWEFFGDLDTPEVGGQPTRIMGRPADVIVALLGSWWGPPSIYLISRQFLKKGDILWDETLQRNQDMDFILQLALNNARFGYDAGIVTRMRVHNEGKIMDSGPRIYGRHCEIVADKVLASLQEGNRMTEKRKQTLADLYWHASRLFWKVDSTDYDRVLKKIKSLYPRFVPQCTTYASPKMKWAIKWLGMRLAERLFSLSTMARQFQVRRLN
jgi:glycosyltransferase involved in cell wall biosynthesis